MNRIEGIDGLRAIGAILVILCHLACGFVPEAYFVGTNASFDAVWNNTPLNFLTSGHAAVQLFFVLSGFFAVSKTYNECKDESVIGLITHKLSKTYEIVIPAIVLAFICIKFNINYNFDVGAISNRYSFLTEYWTFDASIIDVMKDMVFTPFNGSKYVGPFWTIPYDFIGTSLVLIISKYAFKNESVHIRKWIYFIFATIFMYFSINITGFFIGAFVYDVYYNHENVNDISFNLSRFIKKKSVFFIALIFALYCITVSKLGRGIYIPFKVIGYFEIESYRTAVRAFGIGLFILLLLNSEKMKKIFSSKLLVVIGRSSAYIYGFHWTIILSIGCFVFIHLISYVSFEVVVFVVATISILATILCAVIYQKVWTFVKRKVANYGE